MIMAASRRAALIVGSIAHEAVYAAARHMFNNVD